MKTASLAAVVGANCKRIRRDAGVPQDVMALYARNVGLRWTASKVGDFEAGRTAPTFATILAVALTLSNVTNKPVPLSELVSFDGKIVVTDKFSPTSARLLDFCQGEGFEPMGKRVAALMARIPMVSARDMLPELTLLGLAETRVAQQLHISPRQLAELSSRLWRRSFTAERDRRAGPGANAQKRGRVSRTLREELRKALADGNR